MALGWSLCFYGALSECFGNTRSGEFVLYSVRSEIDDLYYFESASIQVAFHPRVWLCWSTLDSVDGEADWCAQCANTRAHTTILLS